MPKFRYGKLVRDNIWSFHEECGHRVEGEVLTGKYLRDALCEKLHEEADEVGGALTHRELIEEIADVQQVIDDLCVHEDITGDEVGRVQKAKRERKGGFLKGQYIQTVTIPNDDDEWAAYCRKHPQKYPETSDANTVTHDDFQPKPDLALGKYRHYRGGEYEVIALACDEATHEWMVVYRPLYDHDGPNVWVRDYAVFVEEVVVDGKKIKRFQSL